MDNTRTNSTKLKLEKWKPIDLEKNMAKNKYKLKLNKDYKRALVTIYDIYNSDLDMNIWFDMIFINHCDLFVVGDLRRTEE